MKRLFKKSVLVAFIFISCNKLIHAQQIRPGTFIGTGLGPFNSSNPVSVSLNNAMTQLNFDIKKGYLKVTTDFGGNYSFGSAVPIEHFDIELHFDLKFLNGIIPVYTESNKTIAIKNILPEGLLYRNLNSFIDNSNNVSGFSYNDGTMLHPFNTIEISNFSYTVVTNPAPTTIVTNDLTIYLSYEIDYIIDPDIGFPTTTLNLPTLNTSNSHVMDFSWATSSNKWYPQYQFQLLRLYNEDESTANNDPETVIDVVQPVDWSKALVFETESEVKSISLFIGEGTGYYAWRVRPIGTAEGGIANNANWGEWSIPSHIPQGYNGQISSSPGVDVFFFTDPERDKNYIYSRTFTEGNNMSEKMTYATVLNQVKQTQVYLPSKNTSVVSQSILDFSGRPAITTLPVPADGGLTGYKEDFVTRPNGDLIRAKEFDTDNNLTDPPVVKDDAGSNFEYYSDVNPDKQIAEAQGFPYTRTVFEKDGSGRIKEQSGAGFMHMLDDDNDQTNGRGRTIRTYYETPSQDELIHMFGDEAPLSENVFKTVTVDQNNTASVTFTNKEGKVIATGLTFEEDDKLEPLDAQSVTGISVNDKVTKNIQVNSKTFVSTKKLTVLAPTPLTVDYRIKCPTLASMCSVVHLNCGFYVKVIIHNPEHKLISYSSGSTTDDLVLPEINISDDLLYPCDINDYKTADIDNGQPISLLPGNYIIEKVLRQEEPPTGNITANMENVNKQVGPITGWITQTLALVDCEKELMMFYNDLFHFVQKLKHNGITPPELIGDNYYVSFVQNGNICEGCSGTDYTFPQPDFSDIFSQLWTDYDIELYGNNGQPITSSDLPFTENSLNLPRELYIKTPCCSLPNFSVLYTPDFRCPSINDLICFKEDVELGNIIWANLDINTDYFDPASVPADPYIADFEGYAISMMKQCFKSDACDDACAVAIAKTKLYDYMRGWHMEGVFNEMVYHMLVDEYNCENYPLDAGCLFTTNVCDPNPSTSGIPPNTSGYNTDCVPATEESLVPHTQYNCKDLAACWKGIILMLMQQTCPNPDVNFGANNDGGNISDGFDKQNHGDGSKHDDHVDDNFDLDIPWPFGWFMEKLMSIRLREKQNVQPSQGGIAVPPPHAQLNLINLFLNCTGYKFADVINTAAANYPFCSPDRLPGFIHPITLEAFDNPCKISLEYDFDPNLLNGHYNPASYFSSLAMTDPDGVLGTIDYSNWLNLKVAPPDPASGAPVEQELWEMFGNIRHPVYAFKYYEYEYGLNNTLEQSTCFRDPNYCYDNAGNLVNCCDPSPCYFCGIGIITCDQTREHWNCGQRYTFFEMLKGYKEPVQDMEEITIFPDDCDRRALADLWYDSPSSLINPDARTPYLNPTEWAYYYSQTVGPYAQYNQPVPSSYHAFLHLDGTLDNDQNNGIYTPISLVEAEAAIMKKTCQDRCEDRRDEFKQSVMKMFTDRCYQIGGCKMYSDDNVVPLEDIDLIVDQLVVQCQSQCTITTYSCEDQIFCRDLNTDVHDYMNVTCTGIPPYPTDCIPPGDWREYRVLNSLPQGNTSRTMEVKMGVGGILNNQTSTPYMPTTDNTMIKYPQIGQTDPLTYGEYTLWLQARNWDFDLDIVSKCNVTDGNATTVDIDNVTYTAYPGAHYIYNPPFTTVYVPVMPSGLFIEQSFPSCALQGDPPNGNTPNTAIPRDDYVTNTHMPDPDMPLGTQVKSPQVGIHVDAPQ